MRDGGVEGPRAAWVVQIAAGRGGQAAQVIMVVMVIKGMDGVSTNHGCEWTQITVRPRFYTHRHEISAMRAWGAVFIYSNSTHKHRATLSKTKRQAAVLEFRGMI